jgi:hypothetical protein
VAASGKPAVPAGQAAAAPFTRRRKRAARSDRDESDSGRAVSGTSTARTSGCCSGVCLAPEAATWSTLAGAIAIVANQSSGASDRRDRGVAIAMARRAPPPEVEAIVRADFGAPDRTPFIGPRRVRGWGMWRLAGGAHARRDLLAVAVGSPSPI